MDSYFEHSKARVRPVARVQMSVLSPEEIRRMSVTQATTVDRQPIPAGITKPENYFNGKPVYGGVNDPRMGSLDRRDPCKTCGCTYNQVGQRNRVNECPGHFGHIELAKPVYHVGFVDDVLRILRCVCYNCSRLMVDPKDEMVKRIVATRRRAARLKALHEICVKGTKRVCVGSPVPEGIALADPFAAAAAAEDQGCGAMQPVYRREGLRVTVIFPDVVEGGAPNPDRKQYLPAEEVYRIFKNMSDEAVEMLGLDLRWARPEWLLITVFPVPPPHVRPSVVMDGSQRSDDDLTHQLATIVKANMKLLDAKKKGEPRDIQEKLELHLQEKVANFFDNERNNAEQEKHKSGKVLKTIRQRLRGKEGRIRGNLMGKRVDFSARTVITADPNLQIDQVGVPRSIALNLTVPETVTRLNIQELQQLVENGPDVHPGAKYIVRDDGTRQDLRYAPSTSGVALNVGWTVERHMRDDDVVLFNRQPSLHKMSIMGHRVKVLDWSTFRLNLSVTTPYNADFDGDEMNLHLPQTLNARAEAEQIMMVPRNIVSPQANSPVMGIVQDALLGCSRLTRRDTFVERDVMMNIMMWVGSLGIEHQVPVPMPAVLKPRPLWTGKQVFSLVLPKGCNHRGNSNMKAPPKDELNSNDSQVLIQDGQVVTGVIDKRSVGNSAGGIIHVTWLDHGWKETARFMIQVQHVVNYWMLQNSFTIGVADTVADTDTLTNIAKEIEVAKGKVRRIVEDAQQGRLEPQPGQTVFSAFEMNVNTLLNSLTERVGEMARNSIDYTNNIVAMILGGSKGNNFNITQIMCCLGQQNVEGKRIPFGFARRSLPHFSKDDYGPESRGFVENSYLKGLTPQEFFFHAMGGREGCIDTAVKTAEVGYIQRRLVKFMESVQAKYDRSVRTVKGSVIQFLYGEDGMDAVFIEKQGLRHLELNRRTFEARYVLDVLDDAFGQIPGKPGEYYLSESVRTACRRDTATATLLQEELSQLLEDRAHLARVLTARPRGKETDTYLPVNLDRLITTARRNERITDRTQSDLDPKDVIQAIKDLCVKTVVVPGEDVFAKQANSNATIMFHIFLRSTFASKRVLYEFRLTSVAFKYILGQVEDHFIQAQVAPGEMAGVQAAQSIGQPATQMTLNTFHLAGVSAKNVTLGVPRLNELLNVAKTCKTPRMSVYMYPDAASDQAKVIRLGQHLEYTTIEDLTLKSEIVYDPDPKTTVVEEDEALLEYWYGVDVDGDADGEGAASPWVIRIELDKDKVAAKRVQLEDLQALIMDVFGPETFQIIVSDQNMPRQVLRLRFVPDDDEDVDIEFLKSVEEQIRSKLKVSGYDKILKVYGLTDDIKTWHPDSGFSDRKEPYFVTHGVNMMEVMACADVDFTRTTCNDLIEIFESLGIEAARSGMLNEIRSVLFFDGGYINYRHMSILVDVMTFRGALTAVSRHGINRGEQGPLLRASFEETVEVLNQASLFGEYDDIQGVTENILLGQIARVGTGVVELLLDEEKLKNAQEMPEYGGGMIGGDDDGMGGGGGGFGAGTPGALTPGIATPYGAFGHGAYGAGGASPGAMLTPGVHLGGGGDMTASPLGTSPFVSPMVVSPGRATPGYDAMASPYVGGGGGTSPYTSASPAYSGGYRSVSSPGIGLGTAASPAGGGYSPSSPAYSPSSPSYSPSSPAYSPSSPAYSPSSPAYSPSSPAYSPSSPAYSPSSPAYSPSSPAYSPSSPAYSPSSPAYSPSSPAFSPSSPAYSPTSPAFSPSSPAYTPTSPQYSPTSPAYTPSDMGSPAQDAAYSPSSPVYSPTAAVDDGEGDVKKE